ncbi:hypothetical protein [Sphingomonas sp. LT1P40]|uniref:hypothetical protein n=1 Tax=Alteristakelama amylovorans TaxID=3096166 RepID=UPI002FCC1220
MKLPQALPHLNGARGTIARVVYLLVAIPTTLLVAASIWFTSVDMAHNLPSAMQFGFRTFTIETGEHHIGRPLPDAARAGVRVGDRIVGIDGVPVPRGANEFQVGERLGAITAPRATFDLVDKKGQSPRSITLPRHPHPWQRVDVGAGVPLWIFVTVEAAAQFIFPLLLIAASLLLFIRRPRDPEAMLFAVAMLMICISGSTIWWWEAAMVNWPLFQGWWLTGWAAAMIAICGFPDGRFVTRWSRSAVIVVLLYLVASWTLLLSFDALQSGWVMMSLNLGFGVMAIATAIALYFRHRRTPPGAERQQMKWVVGGFFVSCLSALTLISLNATIGASDNGDPVRYVLRALLMLTAMIGLPLGLLISLLRFRLYDADAAISRSAVYAVLTVTLLAIFAGSEKIIEALSEQYFGGQLGALAGGAGAALAAVMIAPLHRRLSDWSERRFQQGLIKLRKGLPALVGDLRETASLSQLAAAVLKRVEAGVRAQRGALLVGEKIVALDRVSEGEVAAWRAGWLPPDADGLATDKGDALFPVRLPLEADGCGRVGWLLLGPRPDSTLFGKDEREALAEIADPVARALSIVQQREAREADQTAVATRLGSRVSKLEAMIEHLLGKRGEATS